MKHDFSPPLCTPRRAILSQNSLVSGPFPAPTATLTSHLYHGTVKCGVQRCDKRCLAASCRAATGLRKRRLCCDGLSVVYLRSSSLEYCASIARCVQYMYVSSWPSAQRSARGAYFCAMSGPCGLSSRCARSPLTRSTPVSRQQPSPRSDHRPGAVLTTAAPARQDQTPHFIRLYPCRGAGSLLPTTFSRR